MGRVIVVGLAVKWVQFVLSNSLILKTSFTKLVRHDISKLSVGEI